MVEPDKPNSDDQQVATAQGRLMQLLAKAVAERLAHESGIQRTSSEVANEQASEEPGND